MTSRERLLTALRHHEPDRIPIGWGGGTTGIEVEAYDRLKALLGFHGQTKTFGPIPTLAICTPVLRSSRLLTGR